MGRQLVCAAPLVVLQHALGFEPYVAFQALELLRTVAVSFVILELKISPELLATYWAHNLLLLRLLRGVGAPSMLVQLALIPERLLTHRAHKVLLVRGLRGVVRSVVGLPMEPRLEPEAVTAAFTLI